MSRYFCCLVIPGGVIPLWDGDIPQAFQFLVLHGECNTSFCSLKRVASAQTSPVSFALNFESLYKQYLPAN